MITSLKANERFVFGSNLAGNHAGGAAKQAHEKFSAEMGIGEGLTGQCYAFPTLNQNFERMAYENLVQSRDVFYRCAVAHPDLIFLMTPVGTGIAGYSEEAMRSLFKNPPDNVTLPELWR
jgi:hypothetical protein